MIRHPSLQELSTVTPRFAKSIKIAGLRYYLRTLKTEDVGEKYVGWLNDSDITKYLELRFTKWTRDAVVKYIGSFDNKKTFLFGIFVNNTDAHVGNVSLRVEHHYDIADFGYFIGEKEYWGKGAATEALRLLMEFAFVNLKLRKIYGGASHENIPSIFNFKAMHFKQEGRLRKVEMIDGEWSDTLIFGLLREEWLEHFGHEQV